MIGVLVSDKDSAHFPHWLRGSGVWCCVGTSGLLPHVLARAEVGDSGFWKEVSCGVSWKKNPKRCQAGRLLPFYSFSQGASG